MTTSPDPFNDHNELQLPYQSFFPLSGRKHQVNDNDRVSGTQRSILSE
jgi:hypothetical protein